MVNIEAKRFHYALGTVTAVFVKLKDDPEL